jgi:hypothetical protein
MPEQTPWHRLFVGRDAELAQLRTMLMDCAPSLAPVASGAAAPAARPAVAVLIGDSGQGKSRLVQEFYRRIACAPSGGGLDPEDYWPDAFADPDRCSKVVNPDIAEGQTTAKVPPFIWWGVRWQEPAVGGAPSQVELTSPVHLDCLEAHRDGCKRRVERLLTLAGKSLKLASSSLVPGFPDLPFVDLVKEAIDKGSASIDLAASMRGMREKLDDWRKGRDARRGVQRRRDSALGRVQAVLTGILKPPSLGPIRDASTPVVLWLDDAHWMTPEECACLHALLREAASRSLPLFVIATHWESEWRRAEAEAARTGASVRTGVSNLFEICASLGAGGPEATVRVQAMPLAGRAGARLDLGPCLDAALPGLTPKQRLGVLELAGGNPLLLRLIVEELLRHSERFEGRTSSGRLTAEAEADLGGIAVGEARTTFIGRRIRDLDVGVRRMLEMGSLQGSEFLREVTCQAAAERGIAREEAEAALRHASRLHAILDEGDRTLSFRQDIYRDVLQEALGDSERRAIDAAIRVVLVRRLAAEDPESTDRAMLNELAARFLAVPSGDVDWTRRESRLWIAALLQRLESLDRLGLDVMALARAREIAAIDARTETGIPMSLLGSGRAAFVLRVLARFGTDVESLTFGERLLTRVRAQSAPNGDAETTDLVMQVAELRGAIAQRALYVAALRGAQAALAESDPLAARIALQAAPADVRGPEHAMLEGEASRKGALLRGPIGGNPYRLRDLPGSGHLVAVFDGHLEVVPRVPGETVRFPLSCLAEGCPAMRLSTIAGPEPHAYRLAVGSTAYPNADRGPEVHLHELSRREGAWHLVHRWTLPSGYWGDAAFLDADRVALPMPEGTVSIVRASDGSVLQQWTLPEGVGPVTGIVVVGQDRVALAVGRQIVELDAATGAVSGVAHEHPSRINSLAISPHGRRLGVGGGRHAVMLDRATGESRACKGIEGDVWDVVFAPDSGTLAVLGGDCMVRTFDTETAAPRKTLGEASGITWSAVWDAQGLAFSAEGGEVIQLGQDQVQALAAESDWRILDVDVASGRRLVMRAGEDQVHLQHDGTGACIALRGEATTGASGSFHLVPASGPSGPIAYRIAKGHVQAFNDQGEPMGAAAIPLGACHVVVAPGGDMLLALHGMSVTRVGNLLAALRGEGEALSKVFDVPGVIGDWCSCLLRDRSGAPMVGRMDGAIYDWSEPEPRLVLKVDGWMQSAQQLSDGGWVCGNHNGRVQRVIDGVVVWCTDLRRAYVRSIACCERSSRCYVLMANGPLQVLDLDSGERMCVLGRVEGAPARLALAQDGRRIEAISVEGAVRVWG